MKQLIEEQKRDFYEKTHNGFFTKSEKGEDFVKTWLSYPDNIFEWHENAIKQLIDGLIEHFEEKQLSYEPNLSYQDPDFRITQRVYEDCLGDAISHLKHLRSQIREVYGLPK